MRRGIRHLLTALVLLSVLCLVLSVTGQEPSGAQLKATEAEQPSGKPQPAGQPTTPALPPGPGVGAVPPSSSPPVAIAGMVSVFVAFYLVIILFAVIVGLGGLLLSCLAIYDCARRDFPDPNTRAMWCLLIALLRLIGAIVYYFVIYRKNDPPIQQARILGAPPPSPMSG
jgi:hypothetical protein